MMADVMATRGRRYAVECGGTAMLLAAIVGSGIMGERLSGGNTAIALLANALATGAALLALILTFGPISGAHFNPLVSLAAAVQGDMAWTEAGGYAFAQAAGAFIGVAVANTMFGLPIYRWSHHLRHGLSQVESEAVATFGLLTVIWCCHRKQSRMVPVAVAAYIVAAYWFTASTSFANPAVTLARACTDTFAGIRPTDVGPFLLGQAAGAVAAIVSCRWLLPGPRQVASETTTARSRPASLRALETVIFACVHNAGRSQMAAAFFNALAAPERARALSAGTQPAAHIHPSVVEAMREQGIDMSNARPQRLTKDLAKEGSLLVTMGCGDQCPYVPGLQRDDWPIPDPKDLPISAVRVIRDSIRQRVQWLIDARGWTAH